MTKINDYNELIENICKNKDSFKTNNYMIAISGIGGSGKGYISEKLKESFQKKGFNIHIENLDAWLNLPSIRFSKIDKAKTFYDKAIRFDELFEHVIKPYKNSGKVKTTMNYIEETWENFIKKNLEICNVDIFILEGIYIFQEPYSSYFDYKIWIDCPFETSLSRAINRNQEGLLEKEVVSIYNEVFFPAQRIHFEKDKPYQKADLIYSNF